MVSLSGSVEGGDRHALANYRHSLQHTLDLFDDLDRARNVVDITSKVLQYLAQFGVETS